MKLPCKNKIFLAPMEEVNDPAFRMLCKKAGAGLTYTPLSSPLNPNELILPDKPVLQIFGNKDILQKNAIPSIIKK
jgi:tRNA-dihydrouridine synthase